MADSKVLSASMGRRQHTHGHTTQNVSTDELPDGLALITTIVHPYILKCTLLRAQSRNLDKPQTHKEQLKHIYRQECLYWATIQSTN